MGREQKMTLCLVCLVIAIIFCYCIFKFRVNNYIQNSHYLTVSTGNLINQERASMSELLPPRAEQRLEDEGEVEGVEAEEVEGGEAKEVEGGEADKVEGIEAEEIEGGEAEEEVKGVESEEKMEGVEAEEIVKEGEAGEVEGKKKVNEKRAEVRGRAEERPIEMAEVGERVQKCMEMANLDREPLLTTAKENARYYYNEYRKVIPEKGLVECRSHCWKKGSGRSNLVCVPNIFISGFAKCGSTYLYSFLQNLISMSTNDWEKRQYKKEFAFWVRYEPYRNENRFKPTVRNLENYSKQFAPGTTRVSKFNRTDIMLVDGTPNINREWPRFTKTEDDVTNYCLLPATLPRLFPNSKYINILRNPIDMAYSRFWHSCSVININRIPRAPDIFHERMMTKMDSFNDCMRDESSPNISYACTIQDKAGYSSCIKQRLHLLDKCYEHVVMDIYSPELPKCGTSWLSVAIFYVNVRKWLNLVPRERMLFLTLEELRLHPSVVAGDILQFLDLDTSIASSSENMERILKIGDRNKNQGRHGTLRMREDTRQALEVFYHPFNTLLAELLDNDKFMFF